MMTSIEAQIISRLVRDRHSENPPIVIIDRSATGLREDVGVSVHRSVVTGCSWTACSVEMLRSADFDDDDEFGPQCAGSADPSSRMV